MDVKIRHFKRFVGDSRDLAEMIREDVEEILKDSFYYYISDMLESEGVDLDEAFKNREVILLLEETWDSLRHDLISQILNMFAEYVERRYGLEGMADRYLFCWSSTEGMMCRFERRKAVEDFRRIASDWFAEIAEEYLRDLIPDILYSIAESERVEI